MAIKQAEIKKTVSGKNWTRNLYDFPQGWSMVTFSDGKATGLIVDDYKAATLREAASQLEVDEVHTSVMYNGKSSLVVCSKTAYEIWSGGECLFAAGGDVVAAMDSAGAVL